MQYRMINKIIVGLVFGLLLTMAVSATADRYSLQPLQHHTLQLAAASGNPWALPQAPEKPAQFQRPSQHPNYRYQQEQTSNEYPGFRFVTPQILESLKQQQMQTQQVPGNYRHYQYRPQSPLSPPLSVPSPLMPWQPVPGYYGFPSTGTGGVNPLYDAPVVSPWGSDPDVLYRGESFPWVPDAAIGGIPPMNVLPFAEDSGAAATENGALQNQNKVFNPFTFGRNGNL